MQHAGTRGMGGWGLGVGLGVGVVRTGDAGYGC